VIEDVEELAVEAQLHAFGQTWHLAMTFRTRTPAFSALC